MPSTAHLEILDARELIEAGLTGLEHITSFGTSLVSPMQAEGYRQAVLADNGARRDGRYALFAEADLDGPGARPVEARISDAVPKGSTLTAARRAEGFARMKALARRLHEHGARIVMGGHTSVPHAGRGEAPWRELELLVASGLAPTDALVAATSEAAVFLGAGGADLGAIRPGAAADLVAVDGDPAADVGAVRRVRLVMAEGRFVDRGRLRTA